MPALATTADPVTVANRLRPVLLKLNRHLRREIHTLGLTGGQASLLFTIQRHRGIGVRELAALERMSAPGRPPPRRAACDARGRARPAFREAPPHRLAGRPAQGALGGRFGRGRRSDRAPAGADRRMTAAILALNERTFSSLRRHRNYRVYF